MKFCFGWAIRTAILLKLVGPVAMIASYMPAFAWIAFQATTHHFDQPVMLPEEYHNSKMSFVELQLRSVIGFHANEGLGKVIPMIAVDHIYHHFLPTIVDSHIPQSIKDEIDLMIKEELGVVPVQRSLMTGLLDAYKQHFGLTEQGSTKGFALASKDEGKGNHLFKSVVRNKIDEDRATAVETTDRKVSIENVSGTTLAIVKKKGEEMPPVKNKFEDTIKPKLMCRVASAA